MSGNGALLTPVAVLVLWTLVMFGWMVATRFPAMARAGIDIAKVPPGGRGSNLEAALPAQVSWKAHNVTHLHEAPTLFYATMAVLALTGAHGPLPVALAWLYVALRIVHSIWQATVNVVRVRFMLFAASMLCLAALAVIALMATLDAGTSLRARHASTSETDRQA